MTTGDKETSKSKEQGGEQSDSRTESQTKSSNTQTVAKESNGDSSKSEAKSSTDDAKSESSHQGSSNKESSDKESSNKESSNKESSDKESSGKGSSNKDSGNDESSNKEEHEKKNEKDSDKPQRDEIIKKFPVKTNLENYEETYSSFNWEDAKKEIAYFPGGKMNAAYNAVDRHLYDGRRNKVALYSISANNQLEKRTFQEIYEESNRMGNVLKQLGVKKGDRVFIFLPRIPELYTSTIAIAKIGAIAGPLFSAFGPGALKDRLQDSEAKVIITCPSLKAKLDEIRGELPKLESVIVVGIGDKSKFGLGEYSYEDLVSRASDKLKCEHMDPEDPLYLLYTSGTTGKPKGILHVHNDILGHHMTTKWVLDLRDDDIYWCTADPGWVTGTVYGIFGPWSNGASQVCVEGRFDSEEWYKIIDKLKVTVWYTAPTALRMLMKAGEALAYKYSLKSLRHLLSVGEPLNPEVVRWGMKVYGLPIHDNWWQTETGMQMVANLPCTPVKPGSMGRPLPGVYAAVVDDEGKEVGVETLGKLVVRPDFPNILRKVWNNEEKYKEYFKIPGWYVSGDNARIDEDGYFWFVGRGDDVIKTSGHRVGPFEVESALVAHPAVAEAGVIGKPDEEKGEIIKAFIVLANHAQPTDQLIEEIKQFTKKSLAAHAYPREIEVRDSLPKTRSGKIMRRLLKAWEMGEEVGDTSSLDDD